MSSKTTILAISIAAIMMVCALSGAVMIANSSSNNNGGANDFEKIADTSVILPVEESSDSISMQEYSVLMAEAEKAKKDAANTAAELEAQKIAATEATAELEAQKIAAAAAGVELEEALKEIERLEAAARAASMKSEAATAAVVESKVFVPSTMEELIVVLEKPVFADMTLYEALEGKYFMTADGEVLIDSVQDATSYLCGLGFLVIGENLFPVQTVFTLTAMGAGANFEEVPVADEYVAGVDYDGQISDLKTKIAYYEEKEKNEELSESDLAELADLQLALQEVMKAAGYSDSVADDCVDKNEAEIKSLWAEIDVLRAKMKATDNQDDLDYLQKQIDELEAKISELQKAASSTETDIPAGEDASMALPLFRSIQVITASEFAAGAWVYTPSYEFALASEDIRNSGASATEIAEILERMRADIMGSARSNMMNFLASFDEETLMESSLVQMFYGTPFVMNGEIMNVKDNATLMMFLNSNLGFDFAGTSFILYDYYGDYVFVDVNDMIPYGMLCCQFVNSQDGIHFSGNDFARNVVSEYLDDGQMTKAEFLYAFEFSDVEPNLSYLLRSASYEVPLAMDVFKGTVFYLDGENLVVKDAESFEKYLASLGIAVGNGFVYANSYYDGNIAFMIEAININLMMDLLIEYDGLSAYYDVQVVKTLGEYPSDKVADVEDSDYKDKDKKEKAFEDEFDEDVDTCDK